MKLVQLRQQVLLHLEEFSGSGQGLQGGAPGGRSGSDGSFVVHISGFFWIFFLFLDCSFLTRSSTSRCYSIFWCICSSFLWGPGPPLLPSHSIFWKSYSFSSSSDPHGAVPGSSSRASRVKTHTLTCTCLHICRVVDLFGVEVNFLLKSFFSSRSIFLLFVPSSRRDLG